MKSNLAAILCAAALAVGCASSPDGATHKTVTHREGGIKETSSRDVGLARDRATRAGGRMVFEDRVPSTATEIGRRTRLTDGPRRADASIIARPADDGQVWVVQADTGRIVYGGHLRAGQTLLLNLDRNELSLDGQPISTAPIDGTKQYKIFFLRG